MEPTADTKTRLYEAAQHLAERLTSTGARIVFAESCTAGLVSATLARVPGISGHLCGSAVTYREDTKVQWISVSAEAIENPGVVSDTVAEQMATGVLAVTPEADFAVAITGHLGPNAPEELDGVVFVGAASRNDEPTSKKHHLATNVRDDMVRIERQHLAAAVVLDTASALVLERSDSA